MIASELAIGSVSVPLASLVTEGELTFKGWVVIVAFVFVSACFNFYCFDEERIKNIDIVLVRRNYSYQFGFRQSRFCWLNVIDSMFDTHRDH